MKYQVKNIIAATLVAGLALPALACTADAPAADIGAERTDDVRIQIRAEERDDGMIMPLIPGVTRRFRRSVEGTYSVEYVHPFDRESDAELDYTVELHKDNTYEMRVRADGVVSEHYGHWYNTLNGVTFFYDEPTEKPAHNVFVADTICGEFIAGGKLMIYDPNGIVVLSRTASA